MTTISAVHPDIIRTHILTRLDGPTLASASCASSELHALISIDTDADRLWKNVSTATWPSTHTPRLQQLISAFPSAHRSFFSDAYQINRLTSSSSSSSSSATNNINKLFISAVDIYYDSSSRKVDVILSKVHELDTDTTSRWFRSTPLRVDLLHPKESVATSINMEESELEKRLRLSWIVIDPALKRAANLSSLRPVAVQRHWLSGDVQVRFGSVVEEDIDSSSSCCYYCGILVTCAAVGKTMHVREVSMQVEDVDGRILNGEESMAILQGIFITSEKDHKNHKKKEMIGYVDWMEMKRKRAEKKEKRERNLDMLCMSLGFAIFIAFSSFLLLR